MFTQQGYFNRFYEIIQTVIIHAKAYEQLEDEYFNLYGTNKYTSYESFKVGKHKYLRKNKIGYQR